MMFSTVVIVVTTEMTMRRTIAGTVVLIIDLSLLCDDCLLQCLPIDMLTASLDQRLMGLATNPVPLHH